MKKLKDFISSSEKPEQKAKRIALTFGSLKRAESKEVAEKKKNK